ncbi:hypothetical protein M422DRAFT_67367 [Sphaerobolus stellatus SS14]|uniref:Uncharacterized protein n=1 Tax=Sphaerobolus stellatus (strain SS14) TaxID=990650 RepID=A0A0C9W2H1_SPHS4|nr:hypothetical protein M422DRAFT_67367 [Sphaerobolus stellatus SS14]
MESQQTGEPSSSEAPKKKRKLAPASDKYTKLEDKCDFRTLLKDIRSGRGLPTLKDATDILSAFQTLRQFDTTEEFEVLEDDVLVTNINRSLVALGNLINDIVAHDGSVVASASKADVADCLRNLLVSLLESTLPLAPRHSILPKVTNHLMSSIIRNIILGFHPLSQRIFISLSGSTAKRTKTDIRPNLLRTLKDLLDCLRRIKERSRDIREFIILETAKEIARQWSIKPPPENQHSRHVLAERISCKDSLWYHCSVLHIALGNLSRPSSKEDNDGIVSSIAVDALAALPCLIEERKPADQLAKGMVLGVLEKAWLNGLHTSS